MVASKHINLAALLVGAWLLGFLLGGQRREICGPTQRSSVASRLGASEHASLARPGAEHRRKTESGLIDEALYSTTELARNSAFHEIERRRLEESAKLIKVAGDKDAPPMTRYFAIRLLGLYRVRSAVPTLVKNLDWEYGDVVTDVSYLTGYPCARALVRCDPACAVPLLWDVARAEEKDINDQMLRLRAFVLESVYPNRVEPWGKDDVAGVVERYIDRIPPDWTGARKNVRKLLEKLKQKPGDR